MKKFLFCFLLLFCSHVFAVPFNEIVFFGDSLTDNGNLYKIILKILPKSPPYYNGRFSNGPTWAEDVGKYYYSKHYVGYKIYAIGGATVIYHPPTRRFISPTTLGIEINAYLLDAFFEDKSTRLFSIWIGGNDYMFDERDNPDVASTKVVDQIAASIQKLIQSGAKNFMVLNLPDLSKTPFAKTEGSIPRLALASQLHNEKLKNAVEKIKEQHSDVNIVFVNIYDIFNDVIANPDKYNQKYNVNITDVTDACWTGGYWLRDPLSPTVVRNDLLAAWKNSNNGVLDEAKINEMTQMVLGSPELSYAYKLSKAFQRGALEPCDNANEHLFWDEMHPTEVVHHVLSKVVVELLEFALPYKPKRA